METALITGASGGLGFEFAKICAAHRINLILVARSEDKLRRIAGELAHYGITVDVFVKDLSKVENAEALVDELKRSGIVIQYLFNNAGFGISDEELNIDWKREMEMLTLNMITLTYLTKVFAKAMKMQGYGRILNIGSTASFQPGPYLAGYSATKAYVLYFSEAVNRELRNSDVRITTLCPGVTDTGFHTTAKTTGSFIFSRLPHASADKVAAYGFKIMRKGKSFGIYGFSNRFAAFLVRVIPRNWVTSMAAFLMKPKNPEIQYLTK